MPPFDSPGAKLQATLRDYLQVLFRRKWFFLLPIIIIFFLVTTISFYLPPIYRTSSMIMIQTPPVINPLEQTTGRAVSPPDLAEQLLSIQEQMLSWPRLWELVRRLGLDKGITSLEEMDKVLNDVRDHFSITMRAPNVFELSFEDRDPVKARDAVNILTQIFIESNLSAQREEAVTAVGFIGEQLNRYKKKLEESDRALYEFKEKNLMTFPGMQENVNLQKLVQYESQLVDVTLTYKELTRELDLLKKQLSGDERLIITETTRGLNPLLDELNAQIVKAEMELTNLLVDATEEHPRVIELRGQIAKMKERLARAVEETVNSKTSSLDPVYQRLEQRYRELEINLRNQEARKKELEKLVAEFQKRVDDVPAAERKLAQLTRDNKVNQSVYAMLLQRFESNRISQVEVKERGTEYKIISSARLPLKPSKPRKGLMAIVSIIVGSLLGFGVIFLAEFSDHSLHGMEDAKATLNLPVLAAIPVILTPDDLAAQETKRRNIWMLIAGFSVAFFLSLIIGLIIVSA
ncbi:MAG: hypothetical protein GXO98_07580 [Nitrospirae bacterium]|nr:hypothetical protein [Nitrospirota bacterium]